MGFKRWPWSIRKDASSKWPTFDDWAGAPGDVELPIPGPTRYEPHARATISGRHVCLVLTPNQEIKVFANGREVLRLLNGRWRLLESQPSAASHFQRLHREIPNRRVASLHR